MSFSPFRDLPEVVERLLKHLSVFPPSLLTQLVKSLVPRRRMREPIYCSESILAAHLGIPPQLCLANYF